MWIPERNTILCVLVDKLAFTLSDLSIYALFTTNPVHFTALKRLLTTTGLVEMAPIHCWFQFHGQVLVVR